MLCPEDALHDLAVIRTTFETLDLFPDDKELRAEMMAIITDARANLIQRLGDLRASCEDDPPPAPEGQLRNFKEQILRGVDRHLVDRMMKEHLFVPVGEAEAKRTGTPFDPKFRYEFQPEQERAYLRSLPPRHFLQLVYEDLLHAATEEANLADRHRFEQQVFQKFVAVLFADYASMEPRLGRPEYDQ